MLNEHLITWVAQLKGAGIIKRDNEICDATGYNKSAVSSYLTGKQAASKNFINKFIEVYGESLGIKSDYKQSSQTISMKGSNNKSTQTYNTEPNPQHVNEKEVEYLKQIIKAKDETIEILKQQLKKD